MSTPFSATHGIYGPIFEHWKAQGREVGALGYPTSDVTATPGGIGHFATFRTHPSSGPAVTSAIYATKATGAWSVAGTLLTAWHAHGGPTGLLGYPTGEAGPTLDSSATIQSFSTVVGTTRRRPGFLVDHPVAGRWAVGGSIAATWVALGREVGVLGYPTADRAAGSTSGASYRSQEFEHGAVYSSSVGRGAALWGSLLAAYLDAGGPQGPLGLPLGTQVVSGGNATCDFEGGPLSAPV